MTNLSFDTFYSAFIEAALWSSMDDAGEPLDRYSIDDISDETQEVLTAFARVWWYRNNPYLSSIVESNGRYAGNHGYTLDALAGHDLWLTMAGHGTGFWDREFYRIDRGDYVTDYKDQFTKQAETLGELYLYVGDDGKIYL